ncbi:MAG: hypothetical protein ACRC8S_04185 [Fimbriiglobus sp.]
MRCRAASWGLFVAVSMLITGCSSEPPLVLHPVSGVVTKDGKPVRGGGMMFVPLDPSAKGFSVNAPVNDDGSYTAEVLQTGRDGRTNGTPGVPVGQYKVIYMPANDGQKMGLEVVLKEPITVEPKTNVIKIELPEKTPQGRGELRDDLPDSPPTREPQTQSTKR